MIINELKLINYRNIEMLNLKLNTHINIFYGDNAQGKTNIVESINYLSLLKSFRKVENEKLIKTNENSANIEILNSDNKKIRCVISKDSRKCYINEALVQKVNDFVGIVNTVIFSPEDVNLFRNTPQDRRDFINDELSKISPSYYVCVSEQKNIKKERNDLLKNNKVDLDLLDILTKQMARYDFQIYTKRKEFVQKLNKNLSKIYQKLTNSKLNAQILFKTDYFDCENEKDVEYKIFENIKSDLEKRQTNIGSHKDDLQLLIDGQDISEFGSQAQNRLAVVALKLSTLEIIKEATDDNPIVILDDVLSELDEEKQEKLINELNIINQVFITSTSKLNIRSDQISNYYVECGKVRRI